MSEIFEHPFFGISLSIFALWLGTVIQRKTRLLICNPLLLAILLVIAVLNFLHIPFAHYYNGAKFIDLLLFPATACLGVAIYSKIEILKKNFIPIIAGCFAGSAASLVSVFSLCKLFAFEDKIAFSMLPKSVTAPIALGISSAHGGIASITMVAVVITGVLGSISAPLLIRIFHCREPIAKGISIGTCSHIVGTARAMEMGEVEGALSGLAIGLSGIITVLLAQIVYRWY